MTWVGVDPSAASKPPNWAQTNVLEALVDPNAASAAVQAWVAAVPDDAYRDSILLIG